MGILFRKRTGILLLKMLLPGSLACLAPMAGVAESKQLPLASKWGRFEQSFKSSLAYSNPLQQATLTVLFTSPSGATDQMYGFWDGGKLWRVRFSPDQVGLWSFRTICSDADNRGLHNRTGKFLCTAPTGISRFSEHGPIRVARDRRHFEHADGTAFFWLADTVWNGARASGPKDWEFYALVRATQEFTVAQWSVAPGRDFKNESALGGTPERIAINPGFFQRLDSKLETLMKAGILSAIAPPVKWDGENRISTILPGDQAALLLRYLVARWGAEPVAWLLNAEADDRPIDPKAWKGLGQDVFASLPHAPVVLFAGNTPVLLDDFREANWVDAIGFQPVTDFSDEALRSGLVGPFAKEWNKEPARPLLVLAPVENSTGPQSKKRFTADDVREATYWSLLLTPPAGINYGAEGVMNWDTGRKDEMPEDLPIWQKSLFLPAAKQVSHLAKIMNSVEFWRLRPRPQFIATQPGDSAPRHYIAAAGTEANDLTLVYAPQDRTVEILLEALPPAPHVTWLNPRTGGNSPAVAVVGASTCQFPTPDPGDWLLVMKAGK